MNNSCGLINLEKVWIRDFMYLIPCYTRKLVVPPQIHRNHTRIPEMIAEISDLRIETITTDTDVQITPESALHCLTSLVVAWTGIIDIYSSLLTIYMNNIFSAHVCYLSFNTPYIRVLPISFIYPFHTIYHLFIFA